MKTLRVRAALGILLGIRGASMLAQKARIAGLPAPAHSGVLPKAPAAAAETSVPTTR